MTEGAPRSENVEFRKENPSARFALHNPITLMPATWQCGECMQGEKGESNEKAQIQQVAQRFRIRRGRAKGLSLCYPIYFQYLTIWRALSLLICSCRKGANSTSCAAFQDPAGESKGLISVLSYLFSISYNMASPFSTNLLLSNRRA